MPKIYLSPSTQEKNEYVTGGTEEFHMNQLADAMVPYLISSGIRFARNTPEMTAVTSIRQGDRENVDLYVALHSNAAPESRYGQVRGTDIYYYPTSTSGRRMADILVQNFKKIYPDPSKVRAVASTRLGEVRQPNAPSVLIETAYHDNVEDAKWITNNINQIAQTIVKSITEYFGLPFIKPFPGGSKKGRVSVTSGALNIRNAPSVTAEVIGKLYNGESVTVNGLYDGWYVIQSPGGTVGYVKDDYIIID